MYVGNVWLYINKVKIRPKKTYLAIFVVEIHGIFLQGQLTAIFPIFTNNFISIHTILPFTKSKHNRGSLKVIDFLSQQTSEVCFFNKKKFSKLCTQLLRFTFVET